VSGFLERPFAKDLPFFLDGEKSGSSVKRRNLLGPRSNGISHTSDLSYGLGATGVFQLPVPSSVPIFVSVGSSATNRNIALNRLRREINENIVPLARIFAGLLGGIGDLCDVRIISIVV
jgi:hypothetical protein